MLRKYTRDPNHILQHETLEFEQDLSVEEEPVKVLEKQERRLRGRTITMVRLEWKHHRPEEATWERQDVMKANYPNLFK